MKFVLNELDRKATEAGDRHRLLTDAMRQISLQGMVGNKALSPLQGRHVKQDLITMARNALDTEEARIEVEISALTKEALRAVHAHLSINDSRNTPNALSEALRASEDASVSYLLGEFTSQVNRDVNQTLKDFRNAALRAAMRSQLTGTPRDAANQSVLMEEMQADREPTFIDRAGRRFSGNTHVRRIWRQALRDHWVQVYLQTLASFGISSAVMWHPDVAHRFYGVPIQITDPNLGLKNKEKILHPNSRALPVARTYMEEVA